MFSIRVLRDERICVVAEQRPDCSEEESFQWMSRVLQAVDSIHQVGNSLIFQLQGKTKVWAVSCASLPPVARRREDAGFTQPRFHSSAQPSSLFVRD